MSSIPVVKFPQSPFVDRDGNISREWRQWLLNPQFLSLALQGVLGVSSGGTGLGTLPGVGQILLGNGSGYGLGAVIDSATIDATSTATSISLSISATYAGQSSIVEVGTITTGAWTASTIIANYGGTGISSYTVGDLLYASAATTLSKLADIATGNALLSGGVGAAPAWGKIDLTTHITGTLAATNGGTGQSSYAVGDIIYASTTTALSKLADVATGNALISGGVNTAPSWGKIGLTTHVSGNLPVANLNSGTGASASTFWRGDGAWVDPFGLSGTPTIVAGAGAGTGPTIAIAGTDHGFRITLTTGTLPTLSATICTVTFSGTYSNAPHTVFSPANAATALLSGASMVYGTNTTTTFAMTSGTTALTAATQYIWECVNSV